MDIVPNYTAILNMSNKKAISNISTRLKNSFDTVTSLAEIGVFFSRIKTLPMSTITIFLILVFKTTFLQDAKQQDYVFVLKSAVI